VNKKMSPSEARDEWRSLALQERARADWAEEMVLTKSQDLKRFERIDYRAYRLVRWWDDHRMAALLGITSAIVVVFAAIVIVISAAL
jgi:hypothetical protein